MAPASLGSEGFFRFGVFELDLEAGDLRKGGVKLKLELQPLRVLALLVRHPGEVVTREALRAELWPSGIHVDFDRGLNKAMVSLRQALGDVADSPRFIETIPRRGYRFIAPVVGAAKPESPAVSGTFNPRTGRVPGREPRRAVLASLTVLILAVLAGLGLLRLRQHGIHQPASPHFQSIAVLPFVRLSDAPDQQYFADGLTEALITDLGRISPLRVIARTSVNRYRGTNKSVQQIARELNVDLLTEGTVARSGDHVRITLNLIQVSPERHVWAQSYERDLPDTLILQNEVAAAIAGQIQGKLTPEQQSQAAMSHRINSEAQLAYLKARYFLHNERSPENARKSVAYAELAAQSDSSSALAYAGLAESYAYLSFWGGAPRDFLPRAKVAAERALALDGTLGQAHAALGQVHTIYDWDWGAADRELRRAIELNHNDAEAHRLFASYLAAVGRLDESVDEAKLARDIDPLSFLISRDVGRMLYFARRYDESISELRKAAELQPNAPAALDWIANAYFRKGMSDEAVAAELLEASRRGLSAGSVAGLEQTYARLGLKAYWMKSRALVLQQSEPDEYRLAVLDAELGDMDQAFGWLEKLYRRAPNWITWIKVDPSLDALHSDPRYSILLQRMGLMP